jgi:hypothetical protein
MAAIDFDELFDRLGKIGHIPYALAAAQAAVPADLDALFAEYEGTGDSDLIGSLLTAQDGLPASVVSIASSISGLAAATLVRMVQASVPSIRSVGSSLLELIRQMGVGAESVDQCTVSVSAAALTTNTGAGTVVLSTKRGDGLVQENMVAEVLRLVCSADSYTGGATVGRESFQLAGPPNTVGLWNYNYPTGSGAVTSTTAVSADQDGVASGNLTTNGDVEDWTDDATPELERWTMSGTWGTDMARSGTAYRGSYSLALKAGTTANIYQQFGDGADGTAPVPTPLYSYAVCFRARALAGTVSGGVLTVELVDDTGTVVNDEQGTANSFTLTLSTLSTSWSAVTGVFRVPNIPPDVLRLRLRVSTALAGDDVLLDDVCASQLRAAYPGGFGFAVFSSAVPYLKGDGYDLTATNNRSGENYLGTFQALFDRLFGMRGLNLLLPSSGTPTQPDTKITS